MANVTLKVADRIKYKKTSKKLKGNVHKKVVNKGKVLKRGKNKPERGVVYLGHIPHGFYEEEMKSYFKQFGEVTRVRLARSRRTGRSKGYAFIEFRHCDVAKIVAETMNNYLMYNRLLKTKYIPPDEQHEHMLTSKVTATDYPRKRFREQNAELKNSVLTKEKEDELYKKYQKKIEDFKRFLEERGIEFNFKVNNPNLIKEDDIADDVSESSIGDLYNDELNNHNSCNSTSDPYAVLEIDESDDDIHFKVPPNVKKILKRSSSATAVSNPPKAKKLKHSVQENGTKFPKIKGKLDKWAKGLKNEKNGDVKQKKKDKLNKPLKLKTAKSVLKKDREILNGVKKKSNKKSGKIEKKLKKKVVSKKLGVKESHKKKLLTKNPKKKKLSLS